jgi:hypothetical protein
LKYLSNPEKLMEQTTMIDQQEREFVTPPAVIEKSYII